MTTTTEEISKSQPQSSSRKILRACPMCKGKGYFEQAYSPESSIAGSYINRSIKDGGPVCLPKIKSSTAGRSSGYCQQTCNIRRRLIQGGSLPQLLPSKMVLDQAKGDPGTSNDHQDHQEGLRRNQSARDNFHRLPPINQRRNSLRGSGSNCSDVSELLAPARNIEDIPGVLQTARMRLKSENWDSMVNGLEECVQVARQDSTAVMPLVGLINRSLCSALKSPRTRIVRIAEQSARELFQHIRSVTRPEFDEIVNALLNRTADSVKSVRTDAIEALESMVSNMPLQFTVKALTAKAPSHKNFLVRLSVGKLLQEIVKSIGVRVFMLQPVFKQQRKMVLETACLFLVDQNMEVRNMAKSIFGDLLKEPEFDEVFYSEVNCKLINKTDKTLIMLRYSNEINR